MAMKKVEEKNMKNKKNVKNDKKEVAAKKKEKVVEAVVEEETVVCEECGKKYLASLNECPKCGYSPLAKKKTFYDDEDDFEDYDDEDEEYVPKKEVKKEEVKVEEKVVVKEESKKVSKKEEKKETKKEDKKVVKDNTNKKVSVDSKKSVLADDSNEVLNFIKILVVIVLLVGIVWLIAAVVNKEFKDEEDDSETEETATIQNDKILASSIFEKSDKTYYVFAYNADEDNSYATYYSVLFSEYDYIEDEEKIPMYWVDLNDPLNKDVVAETVEDENTKPQKYADLSIYSPALIRVKDGKLDKYYDGDYAIDKLTRLIASFKETEEE